MPVNTPNNNPLLVAYGQSQPLISVFNPPVLSNRNPGVNDRKSIGSLWVNKSANTAYILTSITNNNANWQLLESSGGAGVFASLTVTPGPVSLTGTTTINTAGAGTTAIGVGGTGAVTIGNATGNTVISAGNLTATSGNIVATAGNINATAGSMSAGTTITAGTGITATTGAITATAGKVIAGTTLQANGDTAGVASTTSLSNVTATAAGGGTVTFAANGGSNITQTGYIKMYVGATAVYIPYFATI